jgi:ribosomal-protein-alanine N-acetyltransferase
MHIKKIIKTQNLLLRCPTETDLTQLGSLWEREEVRQFLGGTINKEEAKNKTIRLKNHWEKYGFGQFAILLKNSLELIGLCGLHHSELEPTIEISYMLFPEYWGKGYAAEAIAACTSHGFDILNLKKIIAITQRANIRSCQLLEKVGMKFKKDLFLFDEHQYVYEISP